MWSVVLPRSWFSQLWQPRSGQVPFHLGEEPGEVEPVGACSAGCFEVGPGPVAGLRGERGVEAARLAAVSVVFVIGEKPCQVAELGLRSRGARAAAVAVRAEHGTVGESRVAEPVNV